MAYHCQSVWFPEKSTPFKKSRAPALQFLVFRFKSTCINVYAQVDTHFLSYTLHCYQSWRCWFHRVWSDAPDHHTVFFLYPYQPSVVHNVFLNTQCMRYSDVIHIEPYTICTKYFLCFKMKPTNPTPKHKHIFFMHLKWFSTRSQFIVRID